MQIMTIGSSTGGLSVFAGYIKDFPNMFSFIISMTFNTSFHQKDQLINILSRFKRHAMSFWQAAVPKIH